MTFRPILYAILSAALFGFSTPAAKTFLHTVNPIMLAGLLYVGAGVGTAVVRGIRSLVLAPPGTGEVDLTRNDVPWLAGAIAAGGVVGPILLMIGLTRTTASAASLLLTLEGVATALIAWFIFKENFDRRTALGMACLVAGAAALSWSGPITASNLTGPLAIVGACVAWGLDNNLTRKVSLSDPMQIVQLKGLVAGPVNVALALWMGEKLPGIAPIVGAALVGFVGYGLSLVLFVAALRHLGAARTGAYFSTAPLFGAAAAVLTLGEPVTLQLVSAGVLMAIGLWLHFSERHEHDHVHDPMEHSHPHYHDEHHRHEHGPQDSPTEPHTHWHWHDRFGHSHPHTPDMHHHHRH
jgi:drug/metabolite transporter (DMT)-like permease